VSLPDDAQLILPPETLPGIADVKSAVTRALEAPLDGLPLAERLTARSKVLIAYDGPGFPVPPLRVDPRLAALEAILAALDARGLPLRNVSLVCSTGLTRLFRPPELARIVGVTALASRASSCHDAEAIDRLAVFGKTTEGELVELDAALTEADLLAFCAKHGIAITSWSPLMRGAIFNEPYIGVIAAIAAKYGKTSAQVVLRWHLQHDVIIIPKSVHQKRIIENAGVFDFALTESDMAAIDGLNHDFRISSHPDNY